MDINGNLVNDLVQEFKDKLSHDELIKRIDVSGWLISQQDKNEIIDFLRSSLTRIAEASRREGEGQGRRMKFEFTTDEKPIIINNIPFVPASEVAQARRDTLTEVLAEAESLDNAKNIRHLIKSKLL